YRDTGGRERSRNFATKREAERWAARATEAVRSGVWIDPDAGTITLEQWTRRWLDAKRSLKPSTRYGYVSKLNTHVLPAFGPTRIGRIDRLAVEGWVAELARDLAPATVRQCHQLLSAILKAAVRSGVIV